ncbi:MAG: LysM peptidoglycan-binding domain-containing protein [Cyclobacteriaceae bacterium]|nr:LysM peptidoglycan-binding domain-containing protein [Cyclobacteriaceae bacterium]
MIRYRYKIALLLLTIPILAFSQDDYINSPSDSSINIFFPHDTDLDYEYVPSEDDYEWIADNLSCLEKDVPLGFNDKVYAFIKHFTTKDRDFIKRVLKRKELYFPVFEKTFEEHQLPDELKYLSIIESALNTTASSRVRAVGLWQFMSYTGRSFKLHQDDYIDERMDFERATDAAASYLGQLHDMFGDWELALASYNTGPGNVRKAMNRSGKDTFWEIYPYLHRETRAYLPQYVAVVYIMNNLEEFNFLIPAEEKQYMIEYDTIMVTDYTHLATLANQLNLCPEELELINPGLKWKAFPESKKLYPIRIPVQSMDLLRDNRMAILDSAGMVDKEKIIKLAGSAAGSTYGKDKIVYRVRSGDVLGKIASRHHVSVADLKRWNNLHGDMIRVGQRLDIWTKPGQYVASKNTPAPVVHKVAPPTVTTDPDGIKTYIVQPGDTLWDISKKFNGMSIEKIKQLNGLSSDNIKPGQKLKIG